MKSKLKNKKVLTALIGVALLLVSIIGVMTVNKQIVFAKDGTAKYTNINSTIKEKRNLK